MFLFILFLLIGLVSFPQYFPGPYPINDGRLPQVLFELKSVRTPTERVHLLLEASNIYTNRPFRLKANLDQAISYAKLGSALSDKIHNIAGYNDAQLYLADSYLDEDHPDSAATILYTLNDTAKINLLLAFTEYYLRTYSADVHERVAQAKGYAIQAEQLSISVKQYAKEIQSQFELAKIHFIEGKRALAEKEIQVIVQKYQAIGYQKLEIEFTLLALINVGAGKKDKAIFYALEAEKTMQQTGDFRAGGDVYLSIGIVYQFVKDYQKGVDYAKLAVTSLSKHSGSIPIYRAILLTVDCMTALGHTNEAVHFIETNIHKYPFGTIADKTNLEQTLGNLYKAQKKYSLAITNYLENLNLERKANSLTVFTLLELGDTYILQHQFKLARPYLTDALRLKDYRLTMEIEKSIRYDIYLCDSAAGDYFSAMNQLNLVRRAEEIINEKVKQEESQKLQVQYETNIKENEIKIKDQSIMLLNQQNQLQQVSLTRERVVRNVTFGGIVFIFLIAALIYIQYRRKLTLNEIITGQNRVINEKNEIQTRLIVEKDWLLKEVHHRVKNNLQMISGLLNAQAGFLKLPEAVDAIQESKQRVDAMSMVHQKLYQDASRAQTDMVAYVYELVAYLEASFRSAGRVRFKLQIERMHFDLSHTIPVCLILNEAITNAIKYAFPDGRHGEIAVQLKRESGEQVLLAIADDGVGLDRSFDVENSGSLGMSLMRGLSEEIGGAFSIGADGGTTVQVVFAYKGSRKMRYRKEKWMTNLPLYAISTLS